MSRNYGEAAGHTKRKRLASRGRNVEVQGGIIIDQGGELVVRCHSCGATAALTRWWLHGTSEDPHAPLPQV